MEGTLDLLTFSATYVNAVVRDRGSRRIDVSIADWVLGNVRSLDDTCVQTLILTSGVNGDRLTVTSRAD